jgi:hypothetical protein
VLVTFVATRTRRKAVVCPSRIRQTFVDHRAIPKKLVLRLFKRIGYRSVRIRSERRTTVIWSACNNRQMGVGRSFAVCCEINHCQRPCCRVTGRTGLSVVTVLRVWCKRTACIIIMYTVIVCPFESSMGPCSRRFSPYLLSLPLYPRPTDRPTGLVVSQSVTLTYLVVSTSPCSIALPSAHAANCRDACRAVCTTS